MNYFDFISKIHNHLNENKLLEKDEYKESPDEILNLVLAVNKTIKNRRAEAVESLAHDLNPPLKRLQYIASKMVNSLKQDILNIHTQCYIAINKLHTTTLENMDVKKSVYDCISSIYMDQYNKKIITINTNSKNLFFRGSYSHFIRVISNLLDNALKATSYEQAQQINIRLYEENFLIKIDIEDNGQGIIQKKLHNIFMDGVSFTGSTGKGLSYCKKTIESWKGTIDCHSTKKVGTTFSISIPKSRAPFDFIENIFYNKKSRFVLIDSPYARGACQGK